MPTYRDVLDFWFPPFDSPDYARTKARWFTKNPRFDAEIRRKFAPLLPVAASGRLEHWACTAEGTLALILVLDQFPRNLFRDSPDAFAFDPLARAYALQGLERGFDLKVGIAERPFFYLPFEHAEDMEYQDLCLDLMEDIPDSKAENGAWHWAKAHFDIIERFGRFPHRNRVLGRRSTPQEQVFLSGPNSSF